MHHFADADDVAQTLDRLDGKELVHLLPRQPGQREERWTHLLADTPAEAPSSDQTADPDVRAPSDPTGLGARIAQLESRVAELERRLAE